MKDKTIRLNGQRIPMIRYANLGLHPRTGSMHNGGLYTRCIGMDEHKIAYETAPDVGWKVADPNRQRGITSMLVDLEKTEQERLANQLEMLQRMRNAMKGGAA